MSYVSRNFRNYRNYSFSRKNNSFASEVKMLDTQSTQLQTWHAGTAAEEAAYEHVLNSKLSELGVQVAGRDALHIMFILTPSQKRIFFFGSPIDGVSEKCVFSCKNPLRCSRERAL